jgi:Na+/H+-dicarboxylate symporter
MKKLGLIPKLIIAIIIGIIIGATGLAFPVKLLATFNSIFGQFLSFSIPLIILAFVVAGIADLGTGAGKLLGITTGMAYGSTLIAGFVAYVVSTIFFPMFITANPVAEGVTSKQELLKPLFTIEIPPLMKVMTALVLAFVLGLGIAATKGKSLYGFFSEFQQIMQKLISGVIIPLLPLHIMGIFANMTHAGQAARVLSVFWKVFLIVIVVHLITILGQFAVACSISKKNIITCLKNQIPGYLTAIGTQSSAATIPVNLKCAENNKVSKGIREFVVPLCATIHLSGSTISLVACAMAVMMLNNAVEGPAKMIGFIAMLGITMVAAPGVPGGAIMAAYGLLQSMLGFNEAQTALMIALYIAQDSFGTACNVSGDNAIAIIVDKINGGKKTAEN